MRVTFSATMDAGTSRGPGEAARRRTPESGWSSGGRQAAIRGLVVPAVLATVLAAASPAAAEVALHALFTSGAVLQQGMKVPIYGTGVDGESLTVRIQDFEATTVVRDGRWRVEVGPLQPGGPFTMQVLGTRPITISNLLVGEVWICGGDANMQWQVLNSVGSIASMTASENAQLRLFTVRREGADEPRPDVAAFWAPAGAGSVGVFSAVGYYFGRELQRKLQIPVGLISCNHHEATTESFISRAGFEAHPELRARLAERPPKASEPATPTVLYNGMAHGILSYGLRGVAWYGGENELDRAYQHRTTFAALIADWRRVVGRPAMPFVFVQAAPYGSGSFGGTGSRWAELRESQLRVWQRTEHTGLAVVTEFGSRFELHPREKPQVGVRLASAALAVAYGEPVAYAGPVYRAHSIDGPRVRLEFDRIGSGLEAPKSGLRGFTVAGADGVFKPAAGAIDGNSVVVSGKEVPEPRAVRYGWSDYPDVNLRNREGLPASPFRTDEYPLTTQPKPAATAGKP